jgi:hypothetical protein
VQSLEIVFYFHWREMMLVYLQTVSYVCGIKLEKKKILGSVAFVMNVSVCVVLVLNVSV